MRHAAAFRVRRDADAPIARWPSVTIVSRPCESQLAGACRNRTYRALCRAQTVLKTAQATRPNPPPYARALRLRRHDVDLDPGTLRQTGRLHRGTRGLVAAKVLGIHLVHLREV